MIHHGKIIIILLYIINPKIDNTKYPEIPFNHSLENSKEKGIIWLVK
jgi:hypothetical protein